MEVANAGGRQANEQETCGPLHASPTPDQTVEIRWGWFFLNPPFASRQLQHQRKRPAHNNNNQHSLLDSGVASGVPVWLIELEKKSSPIGVPLALDTNAAPRTTTSGVGDLPEGFRGWLQHKAHPQGTCGR